MLPKHLMNTTAILLAAGSSTRMGDLNKLLLPFRNKPMISHITDNLLQSKISNVIVVVGYEYEAVHQALHSMPVHIIQNKNYDSGMTGSVQTGIRNLPALSTHFMITLGDMPLISTAHFDIFLEEARGHFSDGHTSIVRPISRQQNAGHPVLFDRKLANDILSFKEPNSLMNFIRKHKEYLKPFITDQEVYFLDTDTPHDYQNLLNPLK